MAGFAWDWADSALWMIWGKDSAWSEEENGTSVEIEAVLVHKDGMSWLKNVKYLD